MELTIKNPLGLSAEETAEKNGWMKWANFHRLLFGWRAEADGQMIASWISLFRKVGFTPLEMTTATEGSVVERRVSRHLLQPKPEMFQEYAPALFRLQRHATCCPGHGNIASEGQVRNAERQHPQRFQGTAEFAEAYPKD